MRAALFWIFALAVMASVPAYAQTRPAPVSASAQIDLNGASRDQLMNLEGIGEVRADAIIRARPFRAKTELVERWIIPESLYDKIADKVTVHPLSAAPAPISPHAPAPSKR